MRRIFGDRTVFVEPAQIAKTLAVAPGTLRFVDARFAFNDPQYLWKEHAKLRPAAPGCVTALAALETDLSRPASELAGATGAGRHPLPEPAAFIRFCQTQLHIGLARSGADSVPTICFDDKGGALAASRLWWMLDNLGHEAYVLSGGIQAYQAAGLPTASGELPPHPEGVLDASAVEKLWPYRRSWRDIASLADVHGAEASATTVVDCRPASRYASSLVPVTPMDKRAGHVPGAINVPFPANLTADMGALSHGGAADALRANFAPILTPGCPDTGAASETAAKRGPMAEAPDGPAGGPTAQPAPIFMCGSGVTACFNLAVARHAGVNDELGEARRPRLFAGSWSGYEDACRDRLVAIDKAAHGVAVLDVRKWPVVTPPSPGAAKTSTIHIRDVSSSVTAAAADGGVGGRGGGAAENKVAPNVDVIAILKQVMPVGMEVVAETACGVRFVAVAE